MGNDNKTGLPVLSFQLPDVAACAPNKPYCVCMHCKRVIMEVNFYHCPVRNCLVQPKYDRDVLFERIATKEQLAKIKSKK